MLQRQLFEKYDLGVEFLQKRDGIAAWWPVSIRLLQDVVVVAGVVVILFAIAAIVFKKDVLHVDPHFRVPWDLWDCFKLAACWHVGRFFLSAIFVAGAPFASERPLYWIGKIFALILLVGVIAHIAVTERGMQLKDLGIHRKRAGHAFLLGIAGLLAIQPFYRAIIVIQTNSFPDIALHDALQAMLQTSSTTALVLGSVVLVVAAPIAEQVLFRGFLQPALQQWFGSWPGLIVCAAFFAAVHNDLYVMAPMFVLGMALGYVYNRSRSLIAPIALHIAHNAISLLTIWGCRHVFSELS